jgi:hypothetical protein
VLPNVNGALTGYLSSTYAAALSEFGQPVLLPRCGGWVLQRSIPGWTAADAMGCYPLFACQEWSSLHSDLETIDHEWVSLSLVADPFGDYGLNYLKVCFPDVMIPFKQHLVVDLSKSPRDFVTDHHARNARKALQRVGIELCYDPIALLDDWISLYDVLTRRHQIRGMTAFSRQSFTTQMQVPGLVVFRATAEGTTTGMLLWYVTGKVAFYHLGAYNEIGYASRASFALFAFAIEYFAGAGLRWLSLGAGAGAQNDAQDGLTRFKSGWSTGSRTAYFCGRILSHSQYSAITAARGVGPTSYFPAYRSGEFG